MIRPSLLSGLALLATLRSVLAQGKRQWVEGYPVPTNNQSDPSSPPFAQGVQLDDIVYKSFETKAKSHRAGDIIQLYTTFKFNRWPEGATSIYCAMRNYNGTATGGGSNFAIKNRREFFHKKKYGTNYQVALSEKDGRIEWVFQRAGEYLQVGHTWTLYAKVVMNKNVDIDVNTWRAYCETKQDAPLKSWYYFKSWMELPITPAGRVKKSTGPVGPGQKAYRKFIRREKRIKAKRNTASKE